MYFEVWVDTMRKKEVEKSLQNICEELHEVSYDYHYIVKVSDEGFLDLKGIKKYRKHYDC